jgi:hypothetical protein
LRISLLNYDHLFAALNGLRFHFLLRTGFQGSFALCLSAHALNGVHDVRLLCQEGVSQVRRP